MKKYLIQEIFKPKISVHKFFLEFVVAIMLLSGLVNASFYFQDNSLPFDSTLRLCNSSTCENLGSYNETTKLSTIGNISTIYEIDNKYNKADLWNMAFHNPSLLIFTVIVTGIGIILIKIVRKK
jgi:hypothetical protein